MADVLSVPDFNDLARYAADHPEDKAFQDDLQKLNALYQDNPLHLFTPHVKQKEFYEVGRIPVKMFAGGNQSGKTLAGIVDNLIQCCDEEALPEHLRQYKFWQPPFKCRVVTPSYGATLDQFQEKLREWAPKSQLVGDNWDSAYKLKEEMLHFKNGSYIQFLSGDQEVRKHSGWTGDRVHFDEEPSGEHGRKLYVEARQRVGVRKGQIIFTMTPDEGVTWSGDEVWEKCGVEPGFFGVQVDMDDNPALSEGSKKIMLAGLTHEEREARKSGKFVYLKGKVYADFDTQKHVIPPPKRSDVKSMDVVISIDPGLKRTAVVWVGFDKEDVALVFDELYLEDHIPTTVSPLIKEKNAYWGLDDPMYVIDPSASVRGLAHGIGVEEAFYAEGLEVISGQNDVDVGIFQTKRRLQGDGLYITDNCESLIWELLRYRFHEIDTPSGKRIVPVKKNDHAVDSLRYALMERFWGPEPDIRKRPKTSDYNFQIPYAQETHQQEVAPMGSMS